MPTIFINTTLPVLCFARYSSQEVRKRQDSVIKEWMALEKEFKDKEKELHQDTNELATELRQLKHDLQYEYSNLDQETRNLEKEEDKLVGKEVRMTKIKDFASSRTLWFGAHNPLATRIAHRSLIARPSLAHRPLIAHSLPSYAPPSRLASLVAERVALFGTGCRCGKRRECRTE